MSKAKPETITRRAAVNAMLATATLIPGAAVAATVCTPDPIFMLIEEHKAANAALNLALEAQNKIAGPTWQPRVQLGTNEPVTVKIGQSEMNIPGNPFYAHERDEIDSHFGEKIEALPPTDVTGRAVLMERRNDLLAEWDKQAANMASPAWDAAAARTERAHDTESAASRALLTTAPTTLTGAVALLRYVEDLLRAGDDILVSSCGDADGYDALVSSLIQALAPFVQK